MPYARTTDPQTSHAAAASVTGLTDVQRVVLNLFRVYGPMTDDQIAAQWGRFHPSRPVSPSGLRTRRHELVQRGLLVDSGERARTPSGRACVVWRVP